MVNLSLLSLLFSLILSSPVPSHRSDDFVSTIGVNIHISYTKCCYYQYPEFKKLLVESGIRNYRDGMLTYDTAIATFNDLGAAGIKGQYIVAPSINLTMVETFPTLTSSTFLRYEGPNEYQNSGDPNWVKTLQSWTKTLWEHHDPKFEVVGPSLITQQASESVGDLSKYVSYGNMHNYKDTFMPETKGWGPLTPYGVYGSTNFSINLTRLLCKDKPIQTSECGWKVMYPPTGPMAHHYVPEDIQAKYIIRLLFQQFALGITSTYIYEFCDCGNGDDVLWGIVAVDNSTLVQTPRPAYYIIKNTISLLADPSGTSFQPGTLDYVLSGDTQDVLTVLLQKKDGTYFLVLWIAKNPWDSNASGTGDSDPGAYKVVPTQNVSLTLQSNFQIKQYSFNTSTGDMVTTILNPSNHQVDITVTDTPIIMAINTSQESTGSVQDLSILA